MYSDDIVTFIFLYKNAMPLNIHEVEKKAQQKLDLLLFHETCKNYYSCIISVMASM